MNIRRQNGNISNRKCFCSHFLQSTFLDRVIFILGFTKSPALVTGSKSVYILRLNRKQHSKCWLQGI